MLDIGYTLRSLLRVDRALTVVGLLMLVSLVGTLAGLAVDPRSVTGSPVWLKPMKFALSTSIYSFTLVWLLGFLRGHPRLVGSTVAVGLAIEVAVISVQAARGTTSHFNFATPFDSTLYALMAGVIGLVWLLNAAFAVLLIRQRLDDAAYAWSLRLGLVLAVVGMAVAVLMTRPTGAQQMAMHGGAAASTIGAHTVGLADGGPGLPVVGWSMVGGDLRVAHFFGLHALQALPLLGWLLSRRTRLDVQHRLGLIWTAAAGYFGLIALLTWQALRGQSVVAPDAATLAVGAALVGFTALMTIGLLAHASPGSARIRAAASSAPGVF